uniref:Uncharacterized protein n=1 Tax=Octopus bimaculoides TaxID=37653 RepID=A0A0L8HZ63_OCTBM
MYVCMYISIVSCKVKNELSTACACVCFYVCIQLLLLRLPSTTTRKLSSTNWD